MKILTKVFCFLCNIYIARIYGFEKSFIAVIVNDFENLLLLWLLTIKTWILDLNPKLH